MKTDAPTPYIEFNEAGHLTVDFVQLQPFMPNGNWREAICPSCDQPIRWVLDMSSWATIDLGLTALVHAWCAWKPEGFDVAKVKATGVPE